MNIKFIDSNHYLFGGKGDVWGKTAHIAQSGLNPNTLCGKPMLSTNHVAFEGIQEPGCEKCIEIYNQKKK